MLIALGERKAVGDKHRKKAVGDKHPAVDKAVEKAVGDKHRTVEKAVDDKRPAADPAVYNSRYTIADILRR